MTDLAPNRTLILEDFRYWISQVSEANGDDCTVRTVLEEMVPFDQVEKPETQSGPVFPAVCVFESETTPPMNYESFGCREEWLDVAIVLHVDATTTTEKKLYLDELQAAIVAKLAIDRRRDGWAVDTKQFQPTRDDAAVLAKQGVNGATATGVMMFRCNFYPDDDTEQAMAQGEIYQTVVVATPITPGTFVPVNGTTISEVAGAGVPPNILTDFSMSDVNGTPVVGRLRYTGRKSRWFQVEASGSLIANASNQCQLRLRKNGASIAKTEVSMQTSATERRTFDVRGMVYLATDDYVDLAVDSAALTSVTLQALILSANQSPKF